MTLEVRRWRSFSCNNSSSYYLVARFSDGQSAKRSAKELDAFFAAHGADSDSMQENGLDPIGTPTAAATKLAADHGFEWTGYLAWGDEGLEGDEPDVIVFENSLVIFHYYCGGFGQAIPAYLTAVGADFDKQQRREPIFTFTIRIPSEKTGRATATEVWDYIVGLGELADLEEGYVYLDLEAPPPWGTAALEDMEFSCGVPYPAFNDNETIGFALEVPHMLEWKEITMYLDAGGVTDYTVEVDRPGSLERLRSIATATCPACSSHPMRYVDAKRDGAPSDQLACRSCGGMFELDDIATPDPVKEE